MRRLFHCWTLDSFLSGRYAPVLGAIVITGFWMLVLLMVGN